jgi:hypothetical protein
MHTFPFYKNHSAFSFNISSNGENNAVVFLLLNLGSLIQLHCADEIKYLYLLTKIKGNNEQ